MSSGSSSSADGSNSRFFLYRLFSIPKAFFLRQTTTSSRNSSESNVIERGIRRGSVWFGDCWDSTGDSNLNDDQIADVRTAFASGQIRSIDDWGKLGSRAAANTETNAPPRTPLRVKFMNKSPHALILCWVSTTGTLHHYYRIAPHATHVEKTFTGDAFLISLAPPLPKIAKTKSSTLSFADMVEEETARPTADFDRHGLPYLENNRETVNEDTIVAAYRPMDVCNLSTDDDSYNQHVVIIKPHPRDTTLPWATTFLRGATRVVQGHDMAKNELKWRIHARESAPIKMTGPLIDTRKKVYQLEMFGPWKVQYEPGCWDISEKEQDECENAASVSKRSKQLCAKEQFRSDLMAITNRLPKHAKEKLCNSVTIWVNKSFRHGCIRDPIIEYGACFHPDKNWLKKHKYDVRKLHGVEFYDSSRWYHEDRRLWGPGGVILHELSHAWHWLYVPDGYDNEDIEACYQCAMKEQLYDCVPFHTLEHDENAKARAYAATNVMEYFAELSVALFSNACWNEADNHEETNDDDFEFNKFFPFNRKQLERHDPRAFHCLCKLWGMPKKW